MTSLLFVDLVTEDDIIYQDIMKDGGQKARALYDYQAGKSIFRRHIFLYNQF